MLLLICGLSTQVQAEPVEVRSAALQLNPEQPAQDRIGSLRYLGGLILASDDGRFGGYSGMVVDPDGHGLWAVSDLGHWLRLDFTPAADGLPAAIAAARILPLRDADGRPIEAKRSSDAEALRRLPDGRWLVAFERWHRVWVYAEPGGSALQNLSLPPATAEQPGNGGIEAMAVLPGGALLLFSEEMPAGNNNGAAWMRQGEIWRDLGWPLVDDFKPTDAATAPDGSLIVLERWFSPIAGVRARLRQVGAAMLQDATALPSTVLAEWAPPVSVDNMEALDVRRGPDGATWLYVMSDDNRNTLQRTLLMVFRLEP